jgi:hypothetical protein
VREREREREGERGREREKEVHSLFQTPFDLHSRKNSSEKERS